jgi:hypothetical protein
MNIIRGDNLFIQKQFLAFSELTINIFYIPDSSFSWATLLPENVTYGLCIFSLTQELG